MKIQLKQLQKFVDFDLTPEELAEVINLHITEVEDISYLPGVSGIKVGEIKNIREHPNADKLQLAEVTLGEQDYELVCGAENIGVGQKVPVAVPGAKLPDMRVQTANIRGIESPGMICSRAELGLEDTSEGVVILDQDTEIGTDATKLLAEDPMQAVLELKVLSNRPDYLSYLGIANEVALLLDKELEDPKIRDITERDISTEEQLEVKVRNTTECPRYMAQVIEEIDVKESPEWLKEALVASDIQPINTVVDALNWTMLLYGEPMHAFDMEAIENNQIIVRRAKSGETIQTLDEEKHELSNEQLVITDTDKPLAIAGVIGGADSGVTQSTDTIVIEAANFDMTLVRKGARQLGIRTDSLTRFEKGIDPNLTRPALQYAVGLIQELSEGKALSPPVDIHDQLPTKTELQFPKEKLDEILGVKIPVSEINNILTGLDFTVQSSSQTLKLKVPTFRNDVRGPADIAEEVIRFYGIDQVESSFKGLSTIDQPESQTFNPKQEVIDLLISSGFSQVYLNSLTDESKAMAFGNPVALKKPLQSERSHLKTSLLPDLAEILSGFKEEQVSVFEIGRVFDQSANELPDEQKKLALASNQQDKKEQYRRIKGIIETLIDRLTDMKIEFKPFDSKLLSNGASIETDKQIGLLGIYREVVVAELNLDRIIELINETGPVKYQKPPQFPSLTFDMTIELEKDQLTSNIQTTIEDQDARIETANPIDEYTKEGSRKVTFRIVLRSPEKTLTQADREDVEQKISDLFK